MSEEYSVQRLHRGDVVEFPDNAPDMRVCIVYGGQGCITFSAGNKIDGFFGKTKEEATRAMRDGRLGQTLRQRSKKLGSVEVEQIDGTRK